MQRIVVVLAASPMLLKVVKMPETFDSENQDADHSKWTEFVVGFKAWLTAEL